MTTRRIVVLRLLRDNDDPMRRSVLYREASKDDDFQKVGGRHFWVEDFSWFMKDLMERGQVTQVKERNKVWYVITEIGLFYLLKGIDPNLGRQKIMRRIRYHVVKRIQQLGWASEEHAIPVEKKIAEYASQMKEGDAYVRTRYYTELVLRTARDLEYGDTEPDEDFIKLVEEKTGEKVDKEQLMVNARRQRDVQRRALERKDEYHGECFKCGARIHRRDARKVANELAERLGVETGTVCCGCYDKLMGGESQVETTISA